VTDKEIISHGQLRKDQADLAILAELCSEIDTFLSNSLFPQASRLARHGEGKLTQH